MIQWTNSHACNYASTSKRPTNLSFSALDICHSSIEKFAPLCQLSLAGFHMAYILISIRNISAATSMLKQNKSLQAISSASTTTAAISTINSSLRQLESYWRESQTWWQNSKFKFKDIKREGGWWVGHFWGKIGRRMRNFDGDSKTEIWTSIPNLLEHIFEKVYRKQIYFQHSKERETTHM